MLKKLFSKILAFLKKFWWIILIALAVFYPPFLVFLKSVWSAIAPKLATLWTSVSGVVGGFAKDHGWKTTAAVGLGVVGAISPSTAKKIVSNVAETAGSVVSGAVDVASSAASSLLSNPVVLIGGGVALMLLLKRNSRTVYATPA